MLSHSKSNAVDVRECSRTFMVMNVLARSWQHSCLFCAIPDISNPISLLLLGFKSTSNKFNDLLVFNLGANFNMYAFTALTISLFFQEALFAYLIWRLNKTYLLIIYVISLW